MVVLPNPFPGMKQQRNFAETQQLRHTPVSKMQSQR